VGGEVTEQRVQVKFMEMMLFTGHLQAMVVRVDEKTRPVPMQEQVVKLVGVTVYCPLQVLQAAVAPVPTTTLLESLQLHVPEDGSHVRKSETQVHLVGLSLFLRNPVALLQKIHLYRLRPWTMKADAKPQSHIPLL
jgi:hypothetical protein